MTKPPNTLSPRRVSTRKYRFSRDIPEGWSRGWRLSSMEASLRTNFDLRVRPQKLLQNWRKAIRSLVKPLPSQGRSTASSFGAFHKERAPLGLRFGSGPKRRVFSLPSDLTPGEQPASRFTWRTTDRLSTPRRWPAMSLLEQPSSATGTSPRPANHSSRFIGSSGVQWRTSDYKIEPPAKSLDLSPVQWTRLKPGWHF